MRQLVPLLLPLITLTFAPSCGDGDDPIDDSDGDPPGDPSGPEPSIVAYCGEDAAGVEARIDGLLPELDLEQKIGLMHGAGLTLTDGVWRVEGSEEHGIPGFRMLDGPRGVSRMSGKNATAFPVGMMRGATWDVALEERVGAAMARELLSVGGDVLLAPTINVLRHPRWGRAQETYSEDVHHLGELGVAFIRGVQSEGVLASAKHYAANSIEDTRFDVDVRIDERTLREIYLPHFRRAVVDARVASVMSAYNSVNGLTCDQQVHLLGDILKGEWAFAGFVESDWVLGTHGDSASVRAGLDIEMPAALQFVGLPDAVAAGEIAEEDLDRSVRRILRAQFCFGLDERVPVADDPSGRETEEHLALAREVARRGVVLLKNEGPVLPLGAGVTSILVAGRNADVENIGDEGSSAVEPSSVVTAIEGITERAGPGVTVTHLAGSTLSGEDEAAVLAADAVVVVTGLQAEDEGEGLIAAGDRSGLAIPDGEIGLIEALTAIHPAVVVVLEGGAAFVTAGWDGGVEALLHAFYPGSEGGHALAELLFGDAAPSGRLPFSMPESEEDLPPFDNVSTTVTYDYFHGYRHLERNGTPARYPFGFGLSYTTFAYSDLALSAEEVGPGETLVAEVDVTNEGTVAAIETVQVYVTAVGSRVERAPRDLRGFGQVELAPGERARIAVPVRVEDLAFFDVEGGGWEVEGIGYVVRVGGMEAEFRVR